MRNKLKIISCVMLAMLCVTSFSVAAFASSGDMTETEAPDYSLTPDGNLTLIDDYYQIEQEATEDTEQRDKQFITLQSKNGNYFYLVIDRNGETENVYFLNLVDEADLMALMEDGEEETEAPTCTCTDKCSVGAINTSCPVCLIQISQCAGVEPTPQEPTEPTDPEPPTDDTEDKGGNGAMIAVVLLVLAGGGAAFYFLVLKKKGKTTKVPSEIDDFDLEDEEYLIEEETDTDTDTEENS